MAIENLGDLLSLAGLALGLLGAVVVILAGRRAESALARLAVGAPSATWGGRMPVAPAEGAAERAAPRFKMVFWGMGMLAAGFTFQAAGLLLG